MTPPGPATFLVLYATPTNTEEFDRHYREVHVPLARALPGLRRYTLARQPHTVRGEPCYLVATLQWDSMAELQAAFASPPGRATAADMATLTQLAEVQSITFEEEDA